MSAVMLPFMPTPLGQADMDDDHEVLARLLGGFAEALSTGAGPEEIARRSCDLFEFLRYHFRREEELMAVYRYPRRDEHRHQHMLVAVQIASWFSRIQREPEGFCLGDVEFLERWLNDHIDTDDRDLADYIRNAEARSFYRMAAG